MLERQKEETGPPHPAKIEGMKSEMSSSCPEFGQRVVRVFVSSTFRDMQAERDELAKVVFPQLRRLCERRGVTWGEVDLRWGITAEQAEEGEALPLCLEAIRRCRPYFIGLLGERYGWVPEEIPEELMIREPWLVEHRGQSVTELEILHGALNDPRSAEHALFYFRDPASIGTLPPDQRASFQETPARRRKLADLKGCIRKSGLPLREGYRNPAELGEWVLQDLTAIIERQYPEGSAPDLLDQEAAEHQVFAERRRRVYIGRQEYFERLTEAANGDGPPLVVLGASGSGKSALLANWTRRFQAEHPDELLLLHFIGATSASADWAAMLRRILQELKRHFGLPQEIPDQPAELLRAFANGLSRAAARGRVILVLDALNQLDDRDGAPDLVWLPASLPPNVRLIVSTLAGRSLEELEKRGWPALTVEPLRPAERRRLIEDYLALFSKQLDAPRRERIAAAPQTETPLFLQLVLDELRLFGVHEHLDERIESSLQAPDIPQLYSLILDRYERDFDRGRQGLAREALSLLWAARRGLTEQELREALGTEAGPLPQALWAPFFLAVENALISRSGLLTFGHPSLRQAVHDKYLADEAGQRKAHLRLADHFDPLRYLSEHSVAEVPWQLVRAQDWTRLHELLTDLQFLERLTLYDSYQAISCWNELESNSSFRLVESYRSVIEAPQRHVLSAAAVAMLLDLAGHPVEAAAIHEFLADRFRRSGNLQRLAGSLEKLMGLCYARGQLDRTRALAHELHEVHGRMGRKEDQASALMGLADVEYLQNHFDAAEKLFTEASAAAEGDPEVETAVLAGRAKILYTRGRFDEAMPLFQQLERRYLAEGNLAGASFALGNQGDIFRQRGDLQGALACFQKSEALYERHGDLTLLGAALGGQARICELEGYTEDALRLYQRCEQIFRRLGQPASMAIALLGRARLMAQTDSPSNALAVAEEARSLIDDHALEALRRQLEDEMSMIQLLNRLSGG